MKRTLYTVTGLRQPGSDGTYIREAQFVHVVCWLCLGLGYVARDTFTAEHDERCSVCAGKGTIVTERTEEA